MLKFLSVKNLLLISLVLFAYGCAKTDPKILNYSKWDKVLYQIKITSDCKLYLDHNAKSKTKHSVLKNMVYNVIDEFGDYVKAEVYTGTVDFRAIYFVGCVWAGALTNVRFEMRSKIFRLLANVRKPGARMVELPNKNSKLVALISTESEVRIIRIYVTWYHVRQRDSVGTIIDDGWIYIKRGERI